LSLEPLAVDAEEATNLALTGMTRHLQEVVALETVTDD